MITSSPLATASTIALCSFCFFICGRIMMKYRTTNISTSEGAAGSDSARRRPQTGDGEQQPRCGPEPALLQQDGQWQAVQMPWRVDVGREKPAVETGLKASVDDPVRAVLGESREFVDV